MSNANPLQLLRSNTANKRPDPTALADGRPAVNTNAVSPGLFFKDSAGNLVKVGPVHVGTTAPNASPASGGATGNSLGEQWLDTSGGVYVLKIWDGSAWRSETGTFVDASGDTMTGALVMDNQQQVRFREVTANGTNYIALQAPASVASDKTITLPDVNGTVVTTGDTGTVTSTMIADATIVDADISASAEIAVSKLADGTARQLLQTDAAGTGVEWTSNVDVPGTLDVTGAATFDSTVAVTGALTKSGSNVVTVGDTGTVTSTMILDGTIVNADVNASAAIAGTKISPDFGSQNITTTGTNTAASFIPTSSTVPTNGVYLPAANSVAISTGGSGRLFVDANGNVSLSSTTSLISTNTADTADNKRLILTGGGGIGVQRGAYINLEGNEFSGGGNAGIVAGDNGIINFSAGGTERLRITATGLVGVGASSAPGGGDSRMWIDQAGTNDYGLLINASGGVKQPTLWLRDASATLSGKIVGQSGLTLATSSSATAAITIDTSQRVGVGTTSPQLSCVISNGGAQGIELTGFNAALGTPLVQYYDRNASAWLDVTHRANSHRFNGPSSEWVRIDSSGRVGIGTSSPSSLTHINQNTADAGVLRLTSQWSSVAPLLVFERTAGAVAGALRYNDALAGMQLGTTTSHNFYVMTGGSNAITVDSSQRVGIGTTSPRYNLSIGSTAITSTASPDTIDLGGTFSNTAGSNLKLRLYWDGTIAQGFGISAFQMDYVAASNAAHVFYRGASEAVRIDASSRLLVGTSSSSASAAAVLQGFAGSSTGQGIIQLQVGKNTAATGINENLGSVRFANSDGNIGAWISGEADLQWNSGDYPSRLVFSTTADGASSPTERMRIDNAGSLIYGTSTSPGADIASGTGFYYQISTGLFYVRSNGNPVAAFNRGSNDGTLVEFKQDQVIEGTISVSGTTVSYNGAHLSRWSQLPSGAERTEILRGSVLSNIDEMCEWGEEANEQLNRMKVSDVEGDKNVSGVFQAWDDDDDTYTNDFYCAMTGDFIIRIAPGVTVERGDLLMSAGDGTAKPQDDDIIRSKTIAKVTSINVSCTYDDGSYCVPCVLMAC